MINKNDVKVGIMLLDRRDNNAEWEVLEIHENAVDLVNKVENRHLLMPWWVLDLDFEVK